METTHHLAHLAAPYVEGFRQLTLLAQPHLAAIAEQFAAWEATAAPATLRAQPLLAAITERVVAWRVLAAPAMLRVAPLLERAFAAARAFKALRESQSHEPCFRAAEAVEDGDQRAIVRFTVEALRLPAELWSAAAEVLAMTNDWWWASDPIQELRRQTRAHAGSIDRKDRAYWRRTARLVAMAAPVDPETERSGFRRVELVHDLQAAFARVGLQEETGLALAALAGHDRAGAAQALGMTDRELATGWKRVQRERNPLARLLK